MSRSGAGFAVNSKLQDGRRPVLNARLAQGYLQMLVQPAPLGLSKSILCIIAISLTEGPMSSRSVEPNILRFRSVHESRLSPRCFQRVRRWAGQVASQQGCSGGASASIWLRYVFALSGCGAATDARNPWTPVCDSSYSGRRFRRRQGSKRCRRASWVPSKEATMAARDADKICGADQILRSEAATHREF